MLKLRISLITLIVAVNVAGVLMSANISADSRKLDSLFNTDTAELQSSSDWPGYPLRIYFAIHCGQKMFNPYAVAIDFLIFIGIMFLTVRWTVRFENRFLK